MRTVVLFATHFFYVPIYVSYNFSHFVLWYLILRRNSIIMPEVDPAFLVSAATNSEIFLSGLREIFKRDKYFVVPKISLSFL